MSLSIKEYFALAGSRFNNDDARVIGPVLQELAAAGDVTPSAVVQAAHSENSPLRDYFEWNNAKAANLYREGQASEMIQSVRVRFVSDGKEYATRAYNVVTKPERDHLPREITITNELLPHPLQQVAKALRELDEWRIRYSHMTAMRHINEIITPVLNQISEFRSDFAEHDTPQEIGAAIDALRSWAAEFDGKTEGGELFGEHVGYMHEAIDDAWKRYCEIRADRFAKDKILERENEELRERVAFLENALETDIVCPPEFGLTRSENTLVGMLLKHDLVSAERAMVALYSERPNEIPEPKIIDVFICKIRPKLAPFGIKIGTQFGQGWFMDSASKDELRGLIEARKAAA